MKSKTLFYYFNYTQELHKILVFNVKNLRFIILCQIKYILLIFFFFVLFFVNLLKTTIKFKKKKKKNPKTEYIFE